MSSDEIPRYIDHLEKEVLDIKDIAMNLTWSMRGGVQYTDVLNMSFAEREMIAKLSKENLEVTKKSGLPFF